MCNNPHWNTQEFQQAFFADFEPRMLIADIKQDLKGVGLYCAIITGIPHILLRNTPDTNGPITCSSLTPESEEHYNLNT
jgi:hypothetical protein